MRSIESRSHGRIPRRGEVWWVWLDPALGPEIAKTRPCVILSSTVINERRRTVVVAPLSTSPHASPPLPVRVRCVGRDAVAVSDQIRAVAKERLDRWMGELSPEHLEDVEQALREVLGLA